MNLSLTHPLGLVGLLLMVPVIVFYRRSLVDLAHHQRRLGLLVRTAIILCLVLALSGLRVEFPTGRQSIVFLLDASASIDEAALDRTYAWVNTAWQGRQQGDEGMRIHFAETTTAVVPVTEAPGSLPDLWADRETDTEAGLKDAIAQLGPETGRRIVLFTDGQETRGETKRLLPVLREQGIALDVIPLAPRSGPEVQVSSLDAPRSVHRGEPFEVRVEAYATTPSPARITVFVNGIRTAAQDVTLAAGDNVFTLPQSSAESRLLTIRVQLDAEQDYFVDNNSASALVYAEGEPSILITDSRPRDLSQLRRALQEEGIATEVRSPGGLPRSLSELQNFDLVCLSDVPATDLDPAQMELIRTYVHGFGGGFMMLGGERSFGLGGYYQTPIEEILPVNTRFERERESPSLAMVLVIDKSGSMGGQKIELAKHAAEAAAELLDDQDRIGVIAFDAQSRWICELHAASDKPYVMERIASLQAGGGTSLGPALSAAYSGLELVSAKLKHVIVLSDGHSTGAGFQELVTAMRGSGITVSTVGVGNGADRALLESIAIWGGGRYYFTENPLAIPQIFAKETVTASRSAIQEVPFQPIRAQAHPTLDGIDWENAPFLLGYVVTRPKPTSEMLLVTERGDPLLATWRFGLGQVVAFTSDAKPRWAAEWMDWDGFSSFWAQVFRETLRRNVPGALRVRILPQETGLRILATTGEDDAGEVFAVVTGPEDPGTEHPMVLVAPGQYLLDYAGGERGEVHVLVTRRLAGQVLAKSEASYVQGYPEEFRMKPDATQRMRSWAEGVGGRFDPDPARVLREDRVSGRRSLRLWPYLLSVALLLLPVDIALRRIVLW